MATETEATWIEIVQQYSPRYVESEGKWVVTYQNEYGLEVERFDDLKDAEALAEQLRKGES